MIEELKPLIGKLSIFAKDRMGFSHPPKLFIRQNKQNANKILGRTAHYDPNQESVTLYVTGRHPKDILRSYAHELVHHAQNLRGDLTPEKAGVVSKNYTQDNDHMRNMEKEAYLQGNMCFRDFEDTLDDKDVYTIKLAESKFLKESKKMTTKITKEYLRKQIRRILLEKLEEEEIQEAKPDFPDVDGDGDRTEPISKASKEKKGGDKDKKDKEGDEEKEKDKDGDLSKVPPQLRKHIKGKKEKTDESKVQTPEQENNLYEQRFTPKNNKLFEKLLKEWTK